MIVNPHATDEMDITQRMLLALAEDGDDALRHVAVPTANVMAEARRAWRRASMPSLPESHAPFALGATVLTCGDGHFRKSVVVGRSHPVCGGWIYDLRRQDGAIAQQVAHSDIIMSLSAP